MVSKLLPFGPLLMVSECGGAECTKCNAAQTSTAHTSKGGTTVWAKAHQETLPCFDGIRLESRFFNPMMIARHRGPADMMHDNPQPSQPYGAPQDTPPREAFTALSGQYFVTNDIR
jgi:hypothetical protein